MAASVIPKGVAHNWRRFLVLVVLSLFLCASLSVWFPPPSSPPQRSTETYDLTPRPIELLPPGTVIGDCAPAGWTHLILKSHSHVASGDVERMDATLKHLASFLWSALVARVEPAPPTGPPPYRLSAVAFGIGTRINGQDKIISSQAEKQLGANLSFLERLGLSRAEARLGGLMVAARSETMIVIDAPTQMLQEGRHQVVIFRSCLLLDRQTGKIETVTWVVHQDEGGDYLGTSGDMAVLPPDYLEEIPLHVDGREFVLGLITEKALAMPHLTEGRLHLPLPKDVQPIANRKTLSQD